MKKSIMHKKKSNKSFGKKNIRNSVNNAVILNSFFIYLRLM